MSDELESWQRSREINLRCIEGKETNDPLVQEVWDRWKAEPEKD